MPLVHSRSWEKKGRETVVRGCAYFLRPRICETQQEPSNTDFFLALFCEKSSFH
jgi:hypothetical protein